MEQGAPTLNSTILSMNADSAILTASEARTEKKNCIIKFSFHHQDKLSVKSLKSKIDSYLKDVECDYSEFYVLENLG